MRGLDMYRHAMIANLTHCDVLADLIERHRRRGYGVSWFESELLRAWHRAALAARDYHDSTQTDTKKRG